MSDIATIASCLSDNQRGTIASAKVLADGRILVPAGSVPDYLTVGYSVQRSALNRVGLAVRAHLDDERRRKAMPNAEHVDLRTAPSLMETVAASWGQL